MLGHHCPDLPCHLVSVLRDGRASWRGSPGRRSLSCSTAPSSRAAGSLPGTPAPQGRAGRPGAGQAACWVRPAGLGPTASPSRWGDPARGPLSPYVKSQTGWETPGHSGTPNPLTHLQDERLAMKRNLSGVYSVPIFLWEGQRVAGRWAERGGQGAWAGGSGMGDRYFGLLNSSAQKNEAVWGYQSSC